MKRATLKDIEKETGISRTTIYKVLNNKGAVKEKNRKKILQTIEKLNYSPNSAARRLAMNKPVRIGIVAFTLSGGRHSENYFLERLCEGIKSAEDELKDQRLLLEYHNIRGGTLKEQGRAIREMIRTGQDGVILVPVESNTEKWEDICRDIQIPLIMLNRDIPNSRKLSFIGCDYHRSGRLMGEIVGEMTLPGDVLLLCGGDPVTNYDIKNRLSGILKVLGGYTHIGKMIQIHCYKDQNPEKEIKKYLENGSVNCIVDITWDLVATSRIAEGYKLKILGFDLFDDSINLIREERVKAILSQDLVTQGYLAVKRMFSYLAEEKNPPSKWEETRLEIVMKENLSFFTEWHEPDDLYALSKCNKHTND